MPTARARTCIAADCRPTLPLIAAITGINDMRRGVFISVLTKFVITKALKSSRPIVRRIAGILFATFYRAVLLSIFKASLAFSSAALSLCISVECILSYEFYWL